MTRAGDVNRRQIDGWLWQARHALRKGNVPRACEAMLSALWLLGVDPASTGEAFR